MLQSLDLSVTKLSRHLADDIRKYYDANGYVVIENLLDCRKMNRLVQVLNQKKTSKLFVFNSQDLHIPMRPKLTPFGFIENSMLYPANLKLSPRFSQSVEACLTDAAVSDMLSLLSGASKHTMMQNMLFDCSTGTIEHQDHYYLDANPPGKMIAAWYALEDIHPDSGCFFVLPGSHKVEPVRRGQISDFSDHEDYRKKNLDLIEGSEYRASTIFSEKRGCVFLAPLHHSWSLSKH